MLVLELEPVLPGSPGSLPAVVLRSDPDWRARHPGVRVGFVAIGWLPQRAPSRGLRTLAPVQGLPDLPVVSPGGEPVSPVLIDIRPERDDFCPNWPERPVLVTLAQ